MPQEQEFTIGIEEEYQLVDPETRDLISRSDQIYDDACKLLGDRVKPEMHQCMIEVGTGICKTPKQAKAELIELRNAISEIAEKHGCRIVAASTHPFGNWADQKITQHDRYV